jgi:cation diffusion facilitator CzcD-associated flavoprotein CzcO
VRDRELRAKLVPDYAFGCKRVLFSNDWYPALAQANVDVVTEPVVEVLPEGVRSGDGQVHEVDVIIYGTGFAATEFLAPIQVTGLGGADLHSGWKEGAHAYLGMCVPDFPNLFVVYGPNTNLGGSSIINMLEAASRAIVTLLRHTDSQGASSVVVRPEAERRYDEEIQGRLGDSVWASCHNWYHEDGGRISTNWPGLVKEYQRRCDELDLADFATA